MQIYSIDVDVLFGIADRYAQSLSILDALFLNKNLIPVLLNPVR